MEPELINWDVALLLELVGPLSTVLVLLILPFRSNAFLEEVVVGFEGEFGGGSNVVLQSIDVSGGARLAAWEFAYVDTPEFLNGVKSDDFLQEIIPVVSLRHSQLHQFHSRGRRQTFPLGGLVNHKVHLCMRGCLTLKLSLSWNTVICSSSLSPFALVLSSALSPTGEIGIVERSTGEEGFTFSLTGAEAVAVAMIAAVWGLELKGGKIEGWLVFMVLELG